MKYFKKLAVAAATLAFALLPSSSVFAHSCSLTLSSNAGKVAKDASFVVSVRLTASSPINVVQAYVTYDSSKVSLQSEEFPAPWSNATPENIKGNGYYQISRYRTQNEADTTTVARLTFRALKSGDTASFGITGANSYALAAGTNELASVAGVSVELEAQASSSSGGNQTAAPTSGNGTPTAKVAVSREEASQAPDKSYERVANQVENSELTADAGILDTGEEVVGTVAKSNFRLSPPVLTAVLIILTVAGVFGYMALFGRNRAESKAVVGGNMGNAINPVINQDYSSGQGSSTVITPENKEDIN